MDRRTFVKLTGGTSLSLLALSSHGRANPEKAAPSLVPADKGFSEKWLESLRARGEPEIYRGNDLAYIGMPVGGLCAGLLYLGGDGKLWLWDIFNRNTLDKGVTYQGWSFGNSVGSTYVEPWTQKSPLSQGFALKYKAGSNVGQRTLDKGGGWSDISFQGTYPLGTVNYSDPAVPITVKLEAFSPFIPLNVDDSSLPATVLKYTVSNPGSVPVEAVLGGWLENAVLAQSSPDDPVVRENQAIHDAHGLGVMLTGHIPLPEDKGGSDIVFADFGGGTYEGWTVEGDAFGTTPAARKDMPEYLHNIGGQGDYVAASHNFRGTNSSEAADDATGSLTSKEFTIERSLIVFYSSGGHRPGEAGIRLLIDGQPVLEQTGNDSNTLTERRWDVAKYRGKKARIQIFDQAKGPWGNVYASKFIFSDREPSLTAINKRHDYGTMALYLVDPGPETSATPTLPTGRPEDLMFGSPDPAHGPAKPVAAVEKSFTLAPGASTTISFVIGWHFANVDPVIKGSGKTHAYAKRFADAAAVVGYVAANFPRLSGETLAWVETWNDSSLPHWFLNRTFGNTCNLATTTSYRFSDGEFWAWEGVYSCNGTCTHVWGYTQAMGRLFPELERALRVQTDYGFALLHDGTINFRGTSDGFAADGQAGIILRTYRCHLMSLDDSFLKPLWPKVRLAMDRLIRQANDKGLLDGPQHNTLDTSWYGEVAWLSGLFLAALRAAEEMAKVCADTEYAQKCRAIFDKGSQSLVPELFNGEYFINQVDPNHLDAINSGTGCEIDQVMGQSWAWQVGLGRIFPQEQTVTALKSLFRYNFAPDAGHYHELMKVGRWYAMPGEAGLLICTFPKPDWDFKKASGKGPEWAALYFNECQSGYEHEAASNMIAEGLVQEGLAVTRAIHDRYAPAKRNPYNEIECGDHYSRAMASYASFISMCGYEYRGPEGYLAFAPRLTPEKFKAAFTSAEGWGSFAQTAGATGHDASINLKWGRLPLKTVGLQPVAGFVARSVRAELDGRPLAAKLDSQGGRMEVAFDAPIKIEAGSTLKISLA